jgi:hypothetical protein
MQVEWYGQSAFRLTSRQATVFIDPFGDVAGLASRGIQWEYPRIEGARTPRIGFLDPPDAFLEQIRHVHRAEQPAFETEDLPATGNGPLVILPATP